VAKEGMSGTPLWVAKGLYPDENYPSVNTDTYVHTGQRFLDNNLCLGDFPTPKGIQVLFGSAVPSQDDIKSFAQGLNNWRPETSVQDYEGVQESIATITGTVHANAVPYQVSVTVSYAKENEGHLTSLGRKTETRWLDVKRTSVGV
jgi:hypothetical protein